MKKDSIKAVSFILLTISIILILNLLFSINYIQKLFDPDLAPFDATVTIADVCGNNICESGEDCTICSVDCGSCPPDPNGGGGGGGGGGGDFGKICQATWDCTQWSNNNQNCGFRDCIDINNCNINVGKPEENIQCPTQGIVDEEPYCGDNICGENEDSNTCINDCPLDDRGGIISIFITIILILGAMIFFLIIGLDKKKRKNLKEYLRNYKIIQRFILFFKYND